LELSDPIYI